MRSNCHERRGKRESMHIANEIRRRRLAHSVLAIAAIGSCLACSGAGGTNSAAKSSSANERSREIVHEPCAIDDSSAEKIDANGDGKPDVFVVSAGGKEQCRAADLDFDGRMDLYSYTDSSGQVSRRELDYDRDGNIDEIQIFKNGELVEKQRASTLARALDTWETYTQGRLVKAERDSDGNGRIDQWWDYKTPDCPIIRSDVDGNGEPDPTSQVDFCSEASYKPPEQAVPTAAPMLQKDTQALPTETSSKTVTEPAGADSPAATANPTQPAKADAAKNPSTKSESTKSESTKSDKEKVK